MSAQLRNIFTVAFREFTWRGRSRAYLITTLILVVVSVAVAAIPIVIRYFDGNSTGEKIGVYVGDTAPSFDAVATIGAVLNIPSTTPNADDGGEPAKPEFIVSQVDDVDAARTDVEEGDLKAVLALERTGTGDLGFTLYSGMRSFERTPQLIQQAAGYVTMQDRLARAGVPEASQAGFFVPTSFSFKPAVESSGSTGAINDFEDLEDFGSTAGVGFALSIFIFMAIMLYGNWVAMSVAEEKSSRVMEVILGAATPFQLMAGKVIGVGAVAVLQLIVVLLPAALVVLFQDNIAAFVLGGSATTDLPQGLTIQLLVAFCVLFVLGFGLYATLYAGAAALVSRQEDVNSIIAPLTILSTAGYLVAVYTSTGLLSLSETVLSVLTYIPFLTPYLMLGEIATGSIEIWQAALGIAILAASVLVALWFAARLYSAGVLMYGQKPSMRNLFRALRTA